MDQRRAKALRWGNAARESVRDLTWSLRGQPPNQFKSASLYSDFFTIGYCDLVTFGRAQPLVAAFNQALHYWAFWPSRLTVEATPLLEVVVLSRNADARQAVPRHILTPQPGMAEDPYHHVSALLLAAMTQDGDAAEHREALRRSPKETAAYGQMLGGVMDGDAAALRDGAEAYLAFHRRKAEKGHLRDEPYGLVAAPVLTALSLGRERGLDVAVADPYLPMYAIEPLPSPLQRSAADEELGSLSCWECPDTTEEYMMTNRAIEAFCDLLDALHARPEGLMTRLGRVPGKESPTYRLSEGECRALGVRLKELNPAQLAPLLADLHLKWQREEEAKRPPHDPVPQPAGGMKSLWRRLRGSAEPVRAEPGQGRLTPETLAREAADWLDGAFIAFLERCAEHGGCAVWH